MSEQIKAESYVVRVYRCDPEDGRKVTGLVELMDGSGMRKPFTNLDELAAVLSHSDAKERRRSNRATAKPR